jgi:phosphonate transport system substrate-binding protein
MHMKYKVRQQLAQQQAKAAAMRRRLRLFTGAAVVVFTGAFAAPATAPTIFKVRPGDTFSGIAARLTGNAREWNKLYDPQRSQLPDPNLILPGMRLQLVAEPDGTRYLRAATATQLAQARSERNKRVAANKPNNTTAVAGTSKVSTPPTAAPAPTVAMAKPAATLPPPVLPSSAALAALNKTAPLAQSSKPAALPTPAVVAPKPTLAAAVPPLPAPAATPAAQVVAAKPSMVPVPVPVPALPPAAPQTLAKAAPQLSAAAPSPTAVPTSIGTPSSLSAPVPVPVPVPLPAQTQAAAPDAKPMAKPSPSATAGGQLSTAVTPVVPSLSPAAPVAPVAPVATVATTTATKSVAGSPSPANVPVPLPAGLLATAPVAAAAAVAATTATSAQADTRTAPALSAGGDTLVIGVMPNINATVLMAQYDNLKSYLERSTSQKVRIVVPVSLKAYFEATMKGEYDLAVGAPHFARLAQADARMVPVAMYEPRTNAQFITAVDGPLKSARELRGKAVVFANPQSLVALYGRQWLSQQSLEAGKDYEVKAARTDLGVGRMLLSGDAVAAVMSGSEFRSLPPEEAARLKIVEVFARIPNFVILAHPRLGSERTAKIKAKLQSFLADKTEGMAFAKATGVSGIVDADEATLRELDPFITATRRLMVPSP